MGYDAGHILAGIQTRVARVSSRVTPARAKSTEVRCAVVLGVVLMRLVTRGGREGGGGSPQRQDGSATNLLLT